MILEAKMNVCINVKGPLCNGCSFETEDGNCLIFNSALAIVETENAVNNKRCIECLNIFGPGSKNKTSVNK